jgi:hypothetical protein
MGGKRTSAHGTWKNNNPATAAALQPNRKIATVPVRLFEDFLKATNRPTGNRSRAVCKLNPAQFDSLQIAEPDASTSNNQNIATAVAAAKSSHSDARIIVREGPSMRLECRSALMTAMGRFLPRPL